MGGLVWSFRAGKSARLAVLSDERVAVEKADAAITFRPEGKQQATGLIFYPGAMVDPVAYAPLARQIAENGYPVFILKLPLRSAPRPSHADELFRRTEQTMRNNRSIKRWVVGGHSKGGALAARFARAHSGVPSGLLLIGTSHPKASMNDLSGAEFPVLKIYGSNDGLASEAEVNRNREFLPADAAYYRISGGNHAQFGDYGRQLGDHKAGISPEEQQALTLGATLRFLDRIR